MPNSPSRILIAEDDRVIAQVLRLHLTKAGFEVEVTLNGSEALAALGAGRFDFVLSDYQMPDMTGEQLCRHIRGSAEHANVPIALCTAKVHEVDVAGLIVDLGLTHVFFKPFSLREITSAIREALAESPAATG